MHHSTSGCLLEDKFKNFWKDSLVESFGIKASLDRRVNTYVRWRVTIVLFLFLFLYSYHRTAQKIKFISRNYFQINWWTLITK